MRLAITWPAEGEELDGDVIRPGRGAGLRAEDLTELRRELPTAELAVEASSVGKGAAGAGVALVIELTERAVTDSAALIAIGGVVRAVIARVAERRRYRPTIAEPNTLAVLAAACSEDLVPNGLVGARYVGTFGVTTTGGAGTDDRDIWAACFSLGDEAGAARMIFMSPSGTCLGIVTVPAERFLSDQGWCVRSADELRAFWAR